MGGFSKPFYMAYIGFLTRDNLSKEHTQRLIGDLRHDKSPVGKDLRKFVVDQSFRHLGKLKPQSFILISDMMKNLGIGNPQ